MNKLIYRIRELIEDFIEFIIIIIFEKKLNG